MKCDTCGETPLQGFRFCEEHLMNCLQGYANKNFYVGKGLLPNSFEVKPADTLEGKLQRIAWRCISSINSYNGRDACNYLGGMLKNPERYTKDQPSER